MKNKEVKPKALCIDKHDIMTNYHKSKMLTDSPTPGHIISNMTDNVHKIWKFSQSILSRQSLLLQHHWWADRKMLRLLHHWMSILMQKHYLRYENKLSRKCCQLTFTKPAIPKGPKWQWTTSWTSALYARKKRMKDHVRATLSRPAGPKSSQLCLQNTRSELSGRKRYKTAA